ncbi:hypothetical protein [Pedobacter sp. SYP-B3415]|uniref:hypothetical protein n=1 Tax=Pedobacter sp. SYP-B3415 TaxID=2496641 RepID=UPI00101CAA7E|nr:hypothetical protein [Pedobacter sp. SYP-B3415]
MTRKLTLAAALVGLLAACTTDKKPNTSGKPVDSSKTPATQAAAGTNAWTKSLQLLAQSADEQNTGKLKAYFNFPVNADTTQIWELVYNSQDEDKRPKELPQIFTEADFETNYKYIFNEDFSTSLLAVNVAELANKGEYTTQKVNGRQDTCFMIAQYDKKASALQLSVSYPGGTDEEGNYVSEGEYAVIYFFKILPNGQLLFDKVLFAG